MTDALKAAIAAIERHFASSDSREVVTASMVPAAEWAALRDALAAQPAAEPDDTAADWRRLALQFDGHRMQALGHLRALAADPRHADAARAFLAAPPLSGEQVLADRIALIAAQPARAGGDAPQDERAAFEAWCRSVGKNVMTWAQAGGDTHRMSKQALASYVTSEANERWAAWQARAALAAAPQPAASAPAPTDAMVDAYLKAQRGAVEEADRFGRPNAGGLHTNTVREACRAGLQAAIAAAVPQPAASTVPATQDADLSRACVKAWDGSSYTSGECDAVHPMFAFAFEAGAVAALAAAAPAAVEREALRAEQAQAVMPLIGPLLDAWEGADNDTKELIRQEAPSLGKYLKAIDRGMAGIGSSKEGGDA